MKEFIIPPEMKHLECDHRGYPIPFFVPVKNGIPDFRFLDQRKQLHAVENKICGICAAKLPKDFCYWISGPLGLKNRVSSDPAMHRACAEFALSTCPHLLYQQAERRTAGSDASHSVQLDMVQTMQKPEYMFLIKTKTKWDLINEHGAYYMRYPAPVATYLYHYVDGKLTPEF